MVALVCGWFDSHVYEGKHPHEVPVSWHCVGVQRNIMFRGISLEEQCSEEQCFRGSLSFHELTRNAVRERLACELHLVRCILVDPFSMGVNSGQLTSK